MKIILTLTLILLNYLFVYSQSFSSGGSSTIVDNGAEVCNSITVSGLAASINSSFGVTQVCTTLSSACMKDIDMFLVAPDGTRIELTTDNGNNSDGFNNVCFRMDATANGSVTGIPGNNGTTHTGNWLPEGNLYDANNNQNPNGVWQICVRDDRSAGSCNVNGTLTSWTINFGVPPPRAISVQDCNGAIPVCQTTYSETNTYPGQGFVSNEVSTSGNCLASNELNSVWYVFTVETSGNLGFQIVPKSGDPLFDYDFAMFNITTNGCGGITGVAAEGDPISPQVSCNFSTAGGTTGTSAAGTSSNQGAIGTNQNTLIPVTAGQTYAFQVSNFTGGGNGYDLNFNAPGNTASIVDVTPPTYDAIEGTVICGSNVVTFSTSEPIRCTSIFGNEYIVSGPGGYTSSATSVGVNCPGTTDLITLTLATPLPINSIGPFTITVANGGDGNTIADNCGNRQPVSQTINFTSSCVLPFELADFNANRIINTTAKIYWSTYSEIDIDYFKIEKSADGVVFEQLARVEGRNGNNFQNYTVFDYNLNSDIIYYRLSETSFNGVLSYFKTIVLEMENPINIFIDREQSYIQINADNLEQNNNSKITLLDISGKTIYESNLNLNQLENKIHYDNFGEGIYFLHYENQNKNLIFKLFL